MYKAYQWSDFLSFTKKKNHTFTSAIYLYNLACVFGAWCYRILVFTMLIPNINSRFSINNITGKN